MFWFLILWHRVALYLSPRISWTVPFGAVLLTLATVAQIVTIRSERPEPLQFRHALVLTVIVLPALVIMLFPPLTLGSFAATRRTAFTSQAVSTEAVKKAAAQVASGAPSSSFTVKVTQGYIGAAMHSSDSFEALQLIVQRVGPTVDFVGIVTRPKGTPPGQFVLARFVITCCIADAMSVQIPVAGTQSAQFNLDQWVEVQGDLQLEDGSISIEASSIRRVHRPAQPYLRGFTT